MRRLTAIILSILLFQTIGNAQYQEHRQVIYDGNGSSRLLMPDETFTAEITPERHDFPAKAMLHVRGLITQPQPFTSRGEESFRRFEYHIEDNLDQQIRWKDPKSLYFKGEDDFFARTAWNRIPGDRLPSGTCSVTVPVVKSEALAVSDGGCFGVTLDLYYKKAGRANLDIYDQPDSSIFIPVPEGDCKKKNIVQAVDIPSNLACVLVSVGGKGFSGECWLEAPYFKSGKNICWHEPFVNYSEKTDDTNYWLGMNLCERIYPLWELEFDGENVFTGKIFDKSSNVADFYIPLPSNAVDGGKISLTLKSEAHRKSYPYEIHAVEMLWEPARDFELISVPKYVREGDEFGILVETNSETATLTLETSEAVSPCRQTVTFTGKGLHVIKCKAVACATAVPMKISDAGGRTEDAVLKQILNRTGRRVEMSVGDIIYIPLEGSDELSRYIKWYTSQRAGTMMQFRPSYQWSGTRRIDMDILGPALDVLNDIQMPYAWQVEGRALAGHDLNPSLSQLASPMFKGKQAHENDGGYYYWQHFTYYGLYCDIAARHRPYGGIFAKQRPIYTDHGTYIHYDVQKVQDMADGAQYFVDNIRYSKGESTRHTGPSCLFRYFYQAGYDWLGSEMMYAPDDILMCSLRGASRAYSKPQFGSLHAMQWSHYYGDNPTSALRLFMSHSVAYMHGSSHLNTEDALYKTEHDFDRYSKDGIETMKSQHMMMDYVQTHDRRGELHAPIAVIQGRNDAWNFFSTASLWSQTGEKWKNGDMIKSYDLFEAFYPKEAGSGGRHEFSDSPYGAVDFVPVEAPEDVLNKYKLAVFLGWNTYDKADFEHLRDFVFNGGTLIMTAAHANACLQPDEAPAFPEDDAPLREMLGDNYRSMTGKNVIPFGAGKTVFYAQKEYPGSSALKEDYLAEMKIRSEIAVASERELGWIDAEGSVDFAVWQDGDFRTIYVLNTDLEGRSAQKCKLLLGGNSFDISVKPYELKTIRISNDLAVCSSTNNTDILAIDKDADGWKVTAQATAEDSLDVYFKDAVPGGQHTVLKIGGAGIREIGL